MGQYDSRHGVTGIFLTPPALAETQGAQNTLGAYEWADTLFYHKFTSYSGILKTVPANSYLMSNGAYLYSGLNVTEATIYLTNRSDMLNIVPTTSNTVKSVVRDNSNRYKNQVESSGTWNGTASQTYVVRISTPGTAGIAKCDVYGPQGQIMSQNNIINQDQFITCSGNMGIIFRDSGPFYQNDSWAVRGVIAGITQLVVDVQTEGTGYVDTVILKLTGTGDQSSSLSTAAGDTIIINSGLFGQPLSFYNGDYGLNQIGSNLHIAVRGKKNSASDYLRIHGVFVAVGDDEEATAWQ